MSDSDSTTVSRREKSLPAAPAETPAESTSPPSTENGSTPPNISTSGETPFPSQVRFDQPTVISKNPPLAGPANELPLRPSDLGKSLEGMRLDHFELQEFVGGGGMGAVFRALDTRLHRTVAIKILSSEHAADDETVRRFHNEAQSAARLDHENIARAYYVGEDQGLHYIAFEYIQGQNLRDLIERRGQLTLAEIVSFTLQIADALAHASAREVVHRDIKPSNVLITDSGRAKLVDMGLARLHQVSQSQDDLTASGVTLGTFDYISPEQARDPRVADVRSDIYSLGCTLYYMLTGRPPFPEGTVLQKLLQHQGDAPPDPRELNPDVPPELARILARMLAKDPARRYQSPSELVADLLRLANDLDLPTSTTNYVFTPPETARGFQLEQHLPWLVPTILLGVVVAAVYFLPIGTAPPSTTRRAPAIATDSAIDSELAGSLDSSPPDTATGENASAAPVRTPPETATASNDAPPATSADNSTTVTTSESTNLPVDHPVLAEGGTNLPVTDALGPPEISAKATVATPLDGSLSATDLATNSVPTTLPAEVAPVSPSTATSGSTSSGPAVLVVGEESKNGGRRFDTLAAACAAARSGDIVELRYNGRRVEEPIALHNLRLTIRAGEGFQPVVNFAPDELDPLKYPRAMIAVHGRRLALFGIALELDLPRMVPADAWSLIKIEQAELVRLERCSLTIRNAADPESAYHAGVSFLEVGPPALDSIMGSTGETSSTPIGIQLQNCIARGEATFLRADVPPSLDVDWDNGLLATTERFLELGSLPDAPPTGTKVEISLRHLTGVARDGLCLLTATKDSPHALSTTITCTDCILLAAADAVLLDQVGVAPVSVIRNQLVLTGDGNFYEGFGIRRRITGVGPQGAPQQTTEPTWRGFWARVGWKDLPSADRPIHTHQPSDYGVAITPARGGATDGRDAGFDASQLPLLPPAPRSLSTNGPSGEARSGS
ncbi:MAG: serine/threonine protein kinase [Pirellulales bacterium]|nr:serine/threonine protein kinase [Pirellulales bacterium]